MDMHRPRRTGLRRDVLDEERRQASRPRDLMCCEALHQMEALVQRGRLREAQRDRREQLLADGET